MAINNFSNFRNCPGSVASTLDANKYKLLMRISLDDLEIMKGMIIYVINNNSLSTISNNCGFD